MDKPDLVALHFPFRKRNLTDEEIALTRPFFHLGKSSVGVLLIHGFTSTPAVWQHFVTPLKERQITVSGLLLAGHGNKPDDLLTITWEDWYQSVEKAFLELRQHCSQVIVIGHSLGGPLAIHLAVRQSQLNAINQLFLIAPAVFPTRAFEVSIKIKLLPLFQKVGIQFLPPVGGNIKKPDTWEINYPRTAIQAFLELYDCMKASQSLLSQIHMPVTIFQSHQDLLIPTSRAPDLLKQLGSKEKELIWLDHSYHVIPLDNDADMLLKKILGKLT